MAESYFALSLDDQADLLRALASRMGRRAEILEKDLWLCQVLGILFRLPCRKSMAFKGGTSLSKVYKVIERFSEDIDVTIDYRSLIADAPDLESITTNSQRRKLSDTLQAALAAHVRDDLLPALQSALASSLPGHPLSFQLSENAEKLWVFYPSAVEKADAYVRPSILIEFGGRNSTWPRAPQTIVPDIAKYVPGLDLPRAQVVVLSAVRTFWEKATLIHVECHRPQPRAGAERLSRHWYDLACLADHEIDRQAVEDMGLLRDVVRLKATFYRSSHSHYERCTAGGLRLVPPEPLLGALRRDYQAMRDAQMFYGESWAFEAIIERLQALEDEINRRVSASL